MVTIKDVAAAAGVSTSTASRALNDKGSISPKVRAHIKKVAKELNYLPNEMARSLQTQRTHMIGLVTQWADKPFYGRLIQAVESRCYDRGYKLLLYTTGGNGKKENTLATIFDANKLDGAILSGWVNYDAGFDRMNLPVVTIERHLSDEIPMVTCDNEGGGRLAARTLWERGCKCAVMLADEGFAMRERYRGFSAECERLGLRCIRQVTPYNALTEDYLSYVTELFRDYPEMDSIFCVDEFAVLCREACHLLGKSIPEEVQILGYDGLEISKQLRISTIAQPIEDMGALAFDLLMDLIDGELVASRSILPVKLLERATTKNL